MNVIRGLAASNAAYVWSTLARLASTAILARLISPEEMGIWTLGFAVIGLFQIVRDFGTATYIQTTPTLLPENIKTCNGIQMIVGVTFFLLFLVGANQIAAFYREPRVANAIYVLAISFLVIPLSSTIFSTFIREGRFALKSTVELVGQLVFYASAVGLAYKGASYMSAPIAIICSQLSIVLLCLRFRNKSYPMSVSFKNMGAVGRVSGSALGVSVLQHVSDKGPDYVLPRTQSFTQSSLYEKGINCIELVRMAVVEMVGTVLLSSLRIRGQDDDFVFKKLASDTVSIIFLLAVLGAAILYFNAYEFLLTLFGNQWVAARGPFETLTIATPFICLTAFLTKVMYLRQRHTTVLRLALLTRVTMIIVVLALSSRSLNDIAAGVVVSEIVFALVFSFFCREIIFWKHTLFDLVVDTLAIVAIALALTNFLISMQITNHFFSLFLSATSIGVCVVVYFFVFRQSVIRRIKAVLNV